MKYYFLNFYSFKDLFILKSQLIWKRDNEKLRLVTESAELEPNRTTFVALMAGTGHERESKWPHYHIKLIGVYLQLSAKRLEYEQAPSLV